MPDKKISEAKKSERIEYIKRLLKDAEAGDSFCQNQLGAILATGDYVVHQDEEGAVYWYTQAVKKGYADAKWNLATMIRNGEGGLKPNISYALNLIDQAAREGETTAGLFLSDLYREGFYGIEIDPTKSEMYRKMHENHIERPEHNLSQSIDIAKDLGLALKKPVVRFKA
ncbi:MAG: sel1 repeat family protein [Rhodospirillales bacterium]|nr:sel1 repeat family protein [Alphaproteobacteria bacterium]MCB9976544.1 sel1 repeat family protein [Rhodospirillales bacterium]